MKVAKRTAQAFAAVVVLSLLMSGSVFAYSARISHISSFAAPSPLANDKSSTTTTTSASSTTSENEKGGHDENLVKQNAQGNEENENEGEHTLEFKLVAIGGAAGKGDAEVQIRGTDLRLDVQVEHAAESATYSVVLVATPSTPSSTTTTFSTTTATTTTTTSTVSESCPDSIGTFVTSVGGEAEVKLRTTLSPSTYSLGLILCVDGKASLISDPATVPATISTGKGEESETAETNQVNAKQEDKEDEDEIKNAEDSKEIPAVVQVSGSGTTITQIDPKFSVSVSRPSGNSLDVSISAANVTGPRVLLIDLTKDAGALSSLQSLRVTYDGNKISEASSLSQIFSGTSTSPPSFIVLLTSSGVQLLVFVPHFSSHLIELLAPPASASAFAAQVPLLLGAFIAVAAASAVVYMRRKRFLAPGSF